MYDFCQPTEHGLLSPSHDPGLRFAQVRGITTDAQGFYFSVCFLAFFNSIQVLIANIKWISNALKSNQSNITPAHPDPLHAEQREAPHPLVPPCLQGTG